MRIKEIRIPKEGFFQLGEKLDLGIKTPLTMPNIGRLVILAGPNGAGKSRLLRSLADIGEVLSKFTPHEKRTKSIARMEEQLRSHESNLDRAINDPSSGLALHADTYRSNITSVKANLKKLEVEGHQWEWIATEAPYTTYKPIFFIPTKAKLKSAETVLPKDLPLNSSTFSTLGNARPEDSVTSYIKYVLRRGRNAANEKRSGSTDATIDVDIEKKESLVRIVEELLGNEAKLCIDRDDQVSVFGRLDFVDTLSTGQQILLILATALHAQETKLSEALLFLDEPENHLHPKALNQTVELLLDRIPNGQIWIATHSVPLIAKLTANEPTSIWYVHDGEISFAGKKPELVLEGLLGTDEDIHRLRDFTDLPSILAANQFAAECLLPPNTVPAKVGDAQQTQMATILNKLRTGSAPLRVLDFGAGQGRLISALKDADPEASTNYDYLAYDVDDRDNERCKNQIQCVYKSSADRFFTNLGDLTGAYPDGVDIVVMCNVLHELSPSKWPAIFGSESQLYDLLKDDGYLLVVEDHRMPVGEHAHEYGFLVLDSAQLNKLFRITEADKKEDLYFVNDARAADTRRKGRLKAHLIKKQLLSRMTEETRKEAIHALYRQAADEMHKLRMSQARTSAEGVLYAFWMSQFANSALWMKDNKHLEEKN